MDLFCFFGIEKTRGRSSRLVSELNCSIAHARTHAWPVCMRCIASGHGELGKWLAMWCGPLAVLWSPRALLACLLVMTALPGPALPLPPVEEDAIILLWLFACMRGWGQATASKIWRTTPCRFGLFCSLSFFGWGAQHSCDDRTMGFYLFFYTPNSKSSYFILVP